MIYPVILAGGNGSRLWPASRSDFPKQFLQLGQTLSLLQQTVRRLVAAELAEPLLICNEQHRFIAAEQLRQLHCPATILLEPEGRNTAPAIALAAHQLQRQSGDPAPVLLVLPADHLIADPEAFLMAVASLLPAVQQEGKVGTLGVLPTRPESGFGYIQPASRERLSPVQAFVEKPDARRAQQFIDQGYLWNSGMFVLRADVYLQRLQQYCPAMADACARAMCEPQQDLDFLRPDAHAFACAPAESVDYALLEPLAAQGEVIVATLDCGWDDIGSWSALWQLGDKDEQGNVCMGHSSHTELQYSHDNLIYGDQRLIALAGVDNLVVVDSADALLVADKSRAQDIKSLVASLPAAAHEARLRQVYRPWGHYNVLTEGPGYKVKKICVRAGEQISLQRHRQRAEHWVVVAGCAWVTRGDQSYRVEKNQSTYIAAGEIHALQNPGPELLEMIEVQSGDYLGEDDIIRLQDKYGRQ